MIIVKGARNKDGQRTEDYLAAAAGEQDEYGNPFRAIRLRWRSTRYHRNGPNAKSRGFEDAVISVSRSTGNLKITYRKSGSATWSRGVSGVGAYFALVPRTQHNLGRLAKCYEDKLWEIVDSDVDAEVKAMSDKFWADMAAHDESMKDAEGNYPKGYTPEVEYNRERIRRMHVLPSEDLDSNLAPVGHELEHEKAVVDDKAKINNRREMELVKREAELAKRERDLIAANAKIAAEFAPVGTGYSAESMGGLKMHEVKKIARADFGLRIPPEMKKDEIISRILEKQTLGDKTPQEETETVMG